MWQRLLFGAAAVVLLALPSSSGAATPTISEVLETYRSNRQQFETLHVQLHHTVEYTDAYRAAARREVERLELFVKALHETEMTPEEFQKSNPELGYTLDLFIQEMEHQLSFHQSMSKQPSQNESFVEIFQKGEAYQVRNPTHLDGFTPTEWVFPTEPLTEKTLVTTYKQMHFFSWSPLLTPHGKILNGSQPEYTSVTAKHYYSNGARPIPPFSVFADPGTHDCHPIDTFFHQPTESYKITGTEIIDGREQLIVEVPLPSHASGTNTYCRGWIDMKRGALPVKLHLWHGFIEEKPDTLSQKSPDRIMSTDEIREVSPGLWYPSMTVVEKFARDTEKMPKSPPNTKGEEWNKYLAEIAKVPSVVHERETWICDLVEAKAPLSDDFFIMPVPKGTEVRDIDKEDSNSGLYQDE